MDQLSLPGFELLGKIGQGGMATVWKAKQLSLDRLVAIKVLSPRLASDPADVERFHAECRSAAMLKHPGIVQVYDATVYKGLYCLIMEYVAGESLGNRIRRKKKMSEDEVLFVLEHVAHALGHAWKTTGLIHCDIKPDNILIDSDGSVKVTDLGLATTLGGMSSLAQTEEVMGTPQYMSPEQISGTPPLDTRTDIYSMGATVYQMLTGKMLFEGAADDAVLDLQLKGFVPDAIDVQPAVSSRMAWMTEKMLARKREDRHADWTAVSADIDRLMRKSFPAPPFPAAGASVMKRSTRRQKPRQPAPASTKPAYPPASGSDVTILRTVLLIAFLAILATAAIFIFRPSNDQPPPPKTFAPPLPAPAPAPSPANNEKAYFEMYEYARNWWKANPERYQEAIDQFDRVARETKGSKYSLMAVEAARSVRQSREAAIQDILGQLKVKADALAAKHLYEEAAAVYDSYKGRLEQETRRERTAAAKQWRDQAVKMNQAARDRSLAATSALDQLLNETADLAVQGRLPDCLEKIKTAESSDTLAPVKKDLAPFLDLVRRAVTLDQKVAESFEKQKGQEVTVQLQAGPRTLVISEVNNGMVHGDQKVMVGEGVSAASIKIRFSLDELSPRERSQRMGDETEPDVALMRGSAAAKNSAYAEARTHFQHITGAFGTRLLEALAKREAGATAPPPPAASNPAGSVAVNPVPPDDKAAPQDDAPGVKAFPALLVTANPNLDADDVECDANDQGRIVEVTCRSRFLENLDPFKKLAASLESLIIPNNQAASFAALTALPKLKRLDLSDSAITDLAQIRDLKLESLTLNNTRIKDLTLLRGMPLKELGLANTRVFTFDVFRTLSLARLNLANTQFSDFSFIREMPLQELDISGTKVFDFISVRRFPLTVFKAADTAFKDGSLLAEMPLTELNLANSKLADLSPLRRLPLKILTISGTAVKDLSPLKDMKLTELRASNCKIKDVDPLSSMPLERLSCSGSLVENLAPLKGLNLTELEAANTSITDLSPLEGMPLLRLDVSFTKVATLKPVSTSPLKEIRCEGLKLETILTIRSAPVEILYCDMRPGQLGRDFFQCFPLLKDLNGHPWPPRWK
jgi:serine/threonine protein kinase/Leucine-rich repeat (LRR) protein